MEIYLLAGILYDIHYTQIIKLLHLRQGSIIDSLIFIGFTDASI